MTLITPMSAVASMVISAVASRVDAGFAPVNAFGAARVTSQFHKLDTEATADLESADIELAALFSEAKVRTPHTRTSRMLNIAKLALGATALLLLAGHAMADDTCAITTEGTSKLAAYPAVRAFYDAFTTGNPALVDCAVAPTWTNTPSAPGTPAGADGLKPQVGGIHMVFSTYSFATEDVVASGDKVVVRSRVTALQSGPFLGVPPSTTPVQFQTIDIHQLGTDGKLAKSWHVEDWLTYLLMRGALPVGAK